MKSQFERMIAGELYHADDAQLKEKYTGCQKLLYEYNQLSFDNYEKKKSIQKQLFGSIGKDAQILAPFRCDYGTNIYIGDHFFANYDCMMLDVTLIEIGDHVLLGPRVGIYTASHPLDAEVRNTGLEFGKTVKIGNNVWIGANTIVNPGVTIGDNAVIGSGSVVTKSIPANVTALGNPCRVIRENSDKEKQAWKELQKDYEKESGIHF